MKKSKIWISGGVHLKTLEEVRVESGWVEMMLGSRMGIGGSGGSGGSPGIGQDEIKSFRNGQDHQPGKK